MATVEKGNAALVLVEAGKPVDWFYASSTDSVDDHTLFAAASMSKGIAASVMMKLVGDGQDD